MAKHSARRRNYNSKFQALQVDIAAGVGTLGADTVDFIDLTLLADDFWFQSCDLQWSISGHTAGEGPLTVGLANSDLSVTEVKEAIQASPQSRSDIIARERARRPVRRVGIFNGATANESLNDGKPIRTTLKMYVAESDDLQMWIMNVSASPLTTGTIVQIFGTIYGEWR